MIETGSVRSNHCLSFTRECNNDNVRPPRQPPLRVL